ncbi:MAG: hypothetical protein DA407_07345 [Bacteroidetes bacterium]|nr:MAG: hypothetical protein DA407_07345 [Bacteroidota bacterium]
MAPIKFEEQLKEKLELRNIQPSSDAWNKLSDRLDEEGDKQNNKGFWWLGIAATIVGVLLALTFVFKTNTEIVEPTIVDTKPETIIDMSPLQTQDVIKENNAVAIEQKEEGSEEKQQVNKNQITKTPLKSIIKEKQNLLIPKIIDEAVANVDVEEESNEANTSLETKPEILDFEAQKVKDVVAQIQNLQKENKGVSAEDIDALLEGAQKEITMKKLYDDATKTVDAEALLQSVEDDLEQSFRDKVFMAIQSGYETVKTAVAERNN